LVFRVSTTAEAGAQGSREGCRRGRVTAAATPGLVVRDNPPELRYEALVDGRLVGLIRYRKEPGLVVLVHSEIDLDREHTRLGQELVRGALADIRARGLRVVPHCPFVADYIREHPEEADLVGLDPAVPE
jgi:predicted GNAT family acetyltransferase